MPEESSKGLLNTLLTVRGFVFDVVEEVRDRVELLLATGQNAASELVSKVFDYGKGAVLGVIFIAFDLAGILVAQFFFIITALIVAAIGAPELPEDNAKQAVKKEE